MPERIFYGHYVCQRCGRGYTVNDGTWRQCTPDFCHGCLEYLNKQTVLLPDHEPNH